MTRRRAFWLWLACLTFASEGRSDTARPPAANPEGPRHAPAPLLRLHQDESVYAVALSPDGKTLAGTIGKTIQLWETATGKETCTLAGHSLDVRSVAFAPNGKTLASGGFDKEIHLWNTATGKEIRTWSGHQQPVQCVAFSPDGGALASTDDEETVRLWEVASGKLTKELRHPSEVESVAFSPDGKTLASVGGLTTRLWDVGQGKEIRKWTRATLGPGDTPPAVHSVAFSPDGKMLAAGIGNFIRVWEVASRKEVATLRGHEGLVVINALAFSPDSKTLASGSGASSSMDTGEEQCLRLWDVATGKEVCGWGGHPVCVHSLAFSPDGKILASGGDKGVLTWRMPSARQRDK